MMERASSRTFLGRGLASPVKADKGGTLVKAAYEDSVQQSVWIILSTAKGERVMRPDFGCGIHELVFDTITASTSGRVAAAVRDALLRFEPRIDVLDVKVDPGADGGLLLISIDYEVRATNNAFNLVYPFYLDGGAA
jgi:phage baseplate assembly protein W